MKKKNILFHSENICYINVSEDYINDYLEMVNDMNIRKLISTKRKIYTYEQQKEWIETNLKNSEKVFTMIEKNTGKFIGNIELTNATDKLAVLGICITAKMQDKHYGTEALKTILSYAFNSLNLQEVHLGVFSNNERAIYIYKKLGFTEYKVEKSVFVLDGKSIDDIYMKKVK